ncbi:chromosome partitioning protein ParB [Marinicauda salina]|uniref:Chromosome partitioning protein ParB n=1 Tax=Marinicauda salina TaxID=2135793 RepID=A0A2U2BWF3_9PROT|nr:ParB/RepB/Spo0J family partition protein [Marinicauda salina]PWE18348.1 chromosome partitioning protein ParB [Marinicauda salina]
MSADEPQRTRGLGRGLAALLGEGEEAEGLRGEAADAGGGRGVREIPIELIERNPDQPRQAFDEDALSELADSIAEKGLLQPLLVRPAPGAEERYQIVAGERRWRAAQKARLHAAPCLVRELTDRETLEIAIVENVQRTDLNAVEEARAFRQLIENFGHTQEEVARAVGKSRVHVANTLRLLALPDPVLDRLARREISAGHARAVASAPDPAALADEIVEKGLSVRAAEALARKSGAPERKGRSRAPSGGGKDADTRALEADLSERLGLEVDLSHTGEAGELRIRYSTLEQLDDLCRRLTQDGASGAY